ncbi:MAG: PorV/PorQ family protein [Elusimicrobia bacterium]|nr:PorV/PorQ family protein [Elusimicrobiota bacterium]
MRRRAIGCWLLVVGILLITNYQPQTTVFAKERPGITAAPILQASLGARAVSMGGAYTALADDLYALSYNPAGLGTLNFHELTGMYVKGIEDTRLGFFGYGRPLPFSGLAGQGPPGMGGSVLYSDNGKIEFNRTNPDGSFLSSQNIRAGADVVASVGYGERVGSVEMNVGYGNFDTHHYLGLAGKYIRSELAETYRADAYALDVGYLARVPALNFSFGTSLQNLGGRMKFLEESDPLPMIFRTGAAYKLSTLWNQTFTAAVNYDHFYYDRFWTLGGGLEYSYDPLLSLRVGYRFHHDTDGLTLGFGIHQAGFVLDYAWALTEVFEALHRVTLSYRFGGISRSDRPKVRRGPVEDIPKSQRLEEMGEEKPRFVPERKEKKSEEGVPGWIY